MLVDASVARPLRLLFVRRRVVADAVPVLAALLPLIVPGPASGLGLHQPVGHSPLPPAGSAPASGTLGVFRVPMPLAHPGDRHALIDTGNETAVARLVANEGAELTEAALGRVLSGYTGSEAVAESIARRPSLPPAISEHLVSAMAKKLQGYLVSKHALPADAAATLILQPRARATASLLSRGVSGADREEWVFKVHGNGRPTPSTVDRR